MCAQRVACSARGRDVKVDMQTARFTFPVFHVLVGDAPSDQLLAGDAGARRGGGGQFQFFSWHRLSPAFSALALALLLAFLLFNTRALHTPRTARSMNSFINGFKVQRAALQLHMVLVMNAKPPIR